MDGLIDELVKWLVGLVMSGVVALLWQGLKRMKISISVEAKQVIEAFFMRGAAWVEEWARQKAKQGIPVSSEEKLQKAIDKGREIGASVLSRLPRVSDEEAANIIQAGLPGLRSALSEGGQQLGKALRTK